MKIRLIVSINAAPGKGAELVGRGGREGGAVEVWVDLRNERNSFVCSVRCVHMCPLYARGGEDRAPRRRRADLGGAPMRATCPLPFDPSAHPSLPPSTPHTTPTCGVKNPSNRFRLYMASAYDTMWKPLSAYTRAP